MKKLLMRVLSCVAILLFPLATQAAYVSRFDIQMFKPAVDGGDYYTVYDSQTLKAWQGNLGIYVDYSNRPLQFRGTGSLAGRQSIIDHITTVDVFGALGLTDFFTVGLNIPIVAYNWYFTDDAAALSDHGAGMGDMQFIMKLRAVDIDKHRVGLSFIPYVTAPTGDVVRYQGNGHPTGGLKVAFDWRMHERFEMGLNIGGEMRDDVTRNGVRIDDKFTYGLAANLKVGKDWQLIAEAHGSTVIRDFFAFSNSTPIEAGAGFRHYFGDSGLALDFAGYGGITDGLGSSRFRVVGGLRWTSPIEVEAPPPPPPDPRIVNNRIILMGKIFYDTAKATIKPESFPVLDDVVDVMNKNPHVTLVEIQGHTDFRGSDAYNLKLSDARANSAMNYLIDKGISSSRLVAKGYGEGMPIASNSTPEGMSQNRRTEFVILNQNLTESTTSSVYIPASTVDASSYPPATTNPVPSTDVVVPAPTYMDSGDQSGGQQAAPVEDKPVSIVPTQTTTGFQVSPVNAAPMQQVAQTNDQANISAQSMVMPQAEQKVAVSQSKKSTELTGGKKLRKSADVTLEDQSKPNISNGGLVPEQNTRDEDDGFDLESLVRPERDAQLALGGK